MNNRQTEDNWKFSNTYSTAGTTVRAKDEVKAINANKLAEAEKRKSLADNTKNISSVKSLPEVQHFAALVDESFSYDDGYGSHDRPSRSIQASIGYVYFTSEEALEAWVLENSGKKTFKIVSVTPVKIEVKAVFSIVR